MPQWLLCCPKLCSTPPSITLFCLSNVSMFMFCSHCNSTFYDSFLVSLSSVFPRFECKEKNRFLNLILMAESYHCHKASLWCKLLLEHSGCRHVVLVSFSSDNSCGIGQYFFIWVFITMISYSVQQLGTICDLVFTSKSKLQWGEGQLVKFTADSSREKERNLFLVKGAACHVQHGFCAPCLH